MTTNHFNLFAISAIDSLSLYLHHLQALSDPNNTIVSNPASVAEFIHYVVDGNHPGYPGTLDHPETAITRELVHLVYSITHEFVGRTNAAFIPRFVYVHNLYQFIDRCFILGDIQFDIEQHDSLYVAYPTMDGSVDPDLLILAAKVNAQAKKVKSLTVDNSHNPPVAEIQLWYSLVSQLNFKLKK